MAPRQRKSAAQAANDEPQVLEIVSDDQDQVIWVVGDWKGRAHYRCALCPFDTMDGGAMLAHYTNEHAPQAAQTIMTYDRQGRPVELTATEV